MNQMLVNTAAERLKAPIPELPGFYTKSGRAGLKELRDAAFANPFGLADETLPSLLMRDIGKGWYIGLSLNK